MKTRQTRRSDNVLSGLNKESVLNTTEMIMVKGGDGTPDPIILPPNPPKKTEVVTPGGII